MEPREEFASLEAHRMHVPRGGNVRRRIPPTNPVLHIPKKDSRQLPKPFVNKHLPREASKFRFQLPGGCLSVYKGSAILENGVMRLSERQ